MSGKTWRERCAEAEVRGHFTAEDVERAAGWATCAVGEQRAMYPQVIVKMAGQTAFYPDDTKLVLQGATFYGYVSTGKVAEAGKMLDEIEDRVLELKRGDAADA